MKTKSGTHVTSSTIKVSATLIFLLSWITISFSQDDKLKVYDISSINELWIPILNMHNIDLRIYNLINSVDTFYIASYIGDLGTKSNIPFSKNDTLRYSYLELGTIDSLNNGILRYKNATTIYKEDEYDYRFITSALALHDFENNKIEWTLGNMATFSFNSGNLIPTNSISFSKLILDFSKHWAMMTIKK